MDALADILKSIHLSASVDICHEFKGPWGMDIDAGDSGVFHAVLEGECFLYVASLGDTIALKCGDIVAFPTGGAHWVSDEVASERIDGALVKQAIAEGRDPFLIDGGQHIAIASSTKVNLLCGSFEYDTKFRHPLLVDLPCFIHIRAEEVDNVHWHNLLIQSIADETLTEMPGAEFVVNHLCEVLFVHLLRQYIAHCNSRGGSGSEGYFKALNDKQVGKALNLIHSETVAQWSVETLAEQVGLSRAAFSEKFTLLVSLSPKQYLTQWRMQRAKQLLSTTNTSMIDVAEASGYASEASFSKAFKAFFGHPPGVIRRS